MKELVIGVVVAIAYTLFIFFSGLVIGERLQQNDYLKGSVKNTKNNMEDVNAVSSINDSDIFHFRSCL